MRPVRKEQQELTEQMVPMVLQEQLEQREPKDQLDLPEQQVLTEQTARMAPMVQQEQQESKDL